MKWAAVLLWTLGVFAAGWFAGLRYATPRATVAVAPPPEARANAQPSAMPAVQPEAASKRTSPAHDATGGAGAREALAARADGPANGPLNQETMDAVLKMIEQNRLNETIDFQAQIRSDPWASESEAKIHAAVDGQLSMVAGARLLRADCRTTLCQAEVIVPSWASELMSNGGGAGTLHTALSGAGLRVVTISDTDAAEPGTKRLLFTMRPEDAPSAASTANRH